MTQKPTPQWTPNPNHKATRTRTCAVTRQALPPHKLIRFVANPDGHVVADLQARLPGRGVWVSADHAILSKAIKTNVFARGLKTGVECPADLTSQIITGLRQELLSRLGLARRSGQVVLGFEKVSAKIKSGDAGLYCPAADIATDSLSTMQHTIKRSGHTVFIAQTLNSDELGLALGQENVIHVAIKHGPACTHWRATFEKLAGIDPKIGYTGIQTTCNDKEKTQ